MVKTSFDVSLLKATSIGLSGLKMPLDPVAYTHMRMFLSVTFSVRTFTCASLAWKFRFSVFTPLWLSWFVLLKLKGLRGANATTATTTTTMRIAITAMTTTVTGLRLYGRGGGGGGGA